MVMKPVDIDNMLKLYIDRKGSDSFSYPLVDHPKKL